MSRAIDNALDSLEKHSSLSKDGRSWLIAAADPFHDKDFALAGMPDVTNCSTVVQLIKKSLQVTVPTTGPGAVASGANWDCNISLLPDLAGIAGSNDVAYSYNLGSNGVISGGAAVSNSFAPFGGLAVAAGPQGNSLWYNTTNVAGDNPAANYSGIDCVEYLKGHVRVIGMAFEVVNTTAEIYKQGQVTVYRVPENLTPTIVTKTIATTPAVNASYNITMRRQPPYNLGLAQLLFGSRSWAASEGAYVVSRMNSAFNPMLQPQFKNDAYCASDMQSLGATVPIFLDADPGTAGAAQSLPCPFDISGAYFTGLSYTTTLTINVRWIIERMPGPSEGDLVVLATPSAVYDPLALELYSRCMIDQPPGVMIKENPLGEWFRSALSKVADLAPKIGSTLSFIPGAQLLGNAIGGAAKVGSSLIPAKKKDVEKSKPITPGTASTTQSAPARTLSVKRRANPAFKKIQLRVKNR